MITLTCRYLAKDCIAPFSGVDVKDIQKMFLAHVYEKHKLQWNQFTMQSRAALLVTIRNRYGQAKPSATSRADLPAQGPAHAGI